MVTGDMRAEAGGPPRVILGSATALADRGHRVTIYSIGKGTRETLRENAAVKTETFPADRPKFLCRSNAMRKRLTETIDDFDVLHVHGVWEQHAAEAARYFRSAGKPVLVSAHGMLDHWSMKSARLKKKASLRLSPTGPMLRKADFILFGSHEEAGEARAIISPEKHAIVPNGINLMQFSERSTDLQELAAQFPQLANWSRTVLYLSRIHPKKGLDLLVDSFLECAENFPDAGLLIVGIAQDEDYQRIIEKRIRGSRFADRIILTTELTGDQARAALWQADLFALPSHQEGFSMAIVEALAAGLPLLISDKCHVPEVQAADAGIIVSDDWRSLEGGLRDMLSATDERLQTMGRNGQRLAAEAYDWKVIARTLETLYRGRSAGTTP